MGKLAFVSGCGGMLLLAAALQLRHERSQRLPTMTQGVLLLRLKLRDGPVEAAWYEYGVIPEASQAPGIADQHTFPRAARNDRRAIRGRRHKGNYALVARYALRDGDIADVVQHLAQIGLVAGALARIARRVDAWPSAQGIHFDARVISKCREVGDCGGVARLQQCIVGKCLPSLRRRFYAERALRHQVETERCEKGTQLTELAAVAACEDYAHTGCKVWACRANSRPIPDAARFSSASSSWRRNA